jgi:imidazolonepropionase-like amidohydrolase
MVIPNTTGDRRVWLRVGKLLDGFSAGPLRDAQIVYDRVGILWIGGGDEKPPAQILLPGQEGPDFDAPGHVLLPGLIDAHAHLSLDGDELDREKRAANLRRAPEELLHGAQERLARLAQAGIAGICDAGDRSGVGLALAKMCRMPGRPLMPYVDSPGAAIHRRGHYGGFMSGPLEDHASARACVEDRVQAGANRIKLFASGIVDFNEGGVVGEPQMSVADIAAIVAAARSLGRQTMACAAGPAGIECAIEGGVDAIEGGLLVLDDQLGRMSKRNIAWVPALAALHAQVTHADRFGWDRTAVGNMQRMLDRHAASVVRAHGMGIAILAGSAAGSPGVSHGPGLLAELELLERAGLAPVTVINAATGSSVGRLRFSERIGTIKSGCRSRFIITRHSPLDAVTNLRKERIVVFDGDVFETG